VQNLFISKEYQNAQTTDPLTNLTALSTQFSDYQENLSVLLPLRK